MARYTGPSCKLCRREGSKLFLKGTRCMTASCAFERRSYAPGRAPKGFAKKLSDYGVHLREKQKARRIYGILERQFRKYFEYAAQRPGMTGENLLQLLERRLDNLVFRMGFAPSRNAARQLVRHGHILVNGRKVNIPSFLLKPEQEISVKEASRKIDLILEATDASTDVAHLEWLNVDKENFSGKLLVIPSREQIPVEIDDRLIVEFYSK